MNPKISVCIIGLNEESRLEECILSVKDIANEIIYVDSFSTDKSVQVAKKLGAKIIKQKFLGHVQQKDFAVQRARNDWILSLDCDERLSATAVMSVKLEWERRAKESHLSHPSGYEFNRLTFYIYRFIKHSGWYPDKKIRLFNRNDNKWEGENPHDKVVNHSGDIKKLKGDILHYSFNSISDHIKTLELFSTIGAREAHAKGRHSGPLTIIFRTVWVGFRKIFFEFAFLDGVAGLILTGLSMAATWAKYSKLYILNKSRNDPQFLTKNRILISRPTESRKAGK